MTTASYAVAGVTPSPHGGRSPAALLVATGIEKSYGRGLWRGTVRRCCVALT